MNDKFGWIWRKEKNKISQPAQRIDIHTWDLQNIYFIVVYLTMPLVA